MMRICRDVAFDDNQLFSRDVKRPAKGIGGVLIIEMGDGGHGAVNEGWGCRVVNEAGLKGTGRGSAGVR